LVGYWVNIFAVESLWFGTAFAHSLSPLGELRASMNAYELLNETNRLIAASREIIGRIHAILGRIVIDRMNGQQTLKEASRWPEPPRSP
jgi:hypothetical protein